MTYDDKRSDTSYQSKFYLCANDSFMSGWGKARQTSYVAYDLTGLSLEQINRLESWMYKRHDYKYVRFQTSLPRGNAHSHCSIMTPPSHIIGEK
jgi:hypothetical protein